MLSMNRDLVDCFAESRQLRHQPRDLDAAQLLTFEHGPKPLCHPVDGVALRHERRTDDRPASPAPCSPW